MRDHPSYPWDDYSDQPCIMRDRKLKRMVYRKASWQMVKSLFLLPLLPLFLLLVFCKKRWQKGKVNQCIGLSVHVETECDNKTIVPLEKLKEMVDELGVNQLLVRIHLHDRENFDTYINHIETLAAENREISVHLIQHRNILDDKLLLQESLQELLKRLKGKVEYLHIGNSYNRRKWAFHHFREYFKFYQTIQQTSREIAPEMKLIGGSVIDFEIPPFLESLFHFRGGHYDGYGAQLYVDRRGSPENAQIGLNLLKKINLIEIMRQFSWKAKGPLWISEFNWPLRDSGSFSPCKGSVLVNQQTQADYLVRYYLIAIASGKIRTCFWHQMVAPGYGLVDNRPNAFEKRPSYYAFKCLNTLFNGAEVIDYRDGDYGNVKGLYSLRVRTLVDGEPSIVQAFWSNRGPHEISFTDANYWMGQDGQRKVIGDTTKISIEASVLYAVINL